MKRFNDFFISGLRKPFNDWHRSLGRVQTCLLRGAWCGLTGVASESDIHV